MFPKDKIIEIFSMCYNFSKVFLTALRKIRRISTNNIEEQLVLI